MIRLRPRDEKALELLAADLLQPELDRRRRHGARGGDPVPDRAPPAGSGRRRQRRRGAAARAAGGAGPPRVVGAARARLLRRPPLSGAGSLLPRADLGGDVGAGAHRLPLQARAARRGRDERPRRGGARLQRDREPGAAERAGGGAPGRAVSRQPRLRQARRAARAAAGRDRGAERAHPHHERARGAVPRPPGRSRSVGGLPARDPAAGSREPGRARRLRRSLPRQGRLGRAGRPAGVLVRARARARRRAPTSRCAGSRRSRSSPRRTWATPSARCTPGGASRSWRRATRARARRSGACCSRARAGTAWPRCSSARPALQDDPAQKAETLRRVAQIHREKLGDAERAPSRSTARSCAPSRTTRWRCARWSRSSSARATSPGWPRSCASRSSSTRSKQERVSLLRRLLVIYDERLNNLAEGDLGGERDPAGRSPAIATRSRGSRRCWSAPATCASWSSVLEQHTKYAANPDEKVQLLRRAAELVQDKLQRSAGRGRALGRGRAPRSRRRQGARLADRDLHASWNGTRIWRACSTCRSIAWSPIPMEQAAYLRRLAALAEGPLNDIRRAQRAWENICEVLPTDTEALDALSRIYSGEGDWATLVRILEQADPAGRGSDARRRAGAAARADLRRAAAQHRGRGARARAGDRRAGPAQLGGARAPARALREGRQTGRASSRSPSASCS